ncbi:MAG: hypothetical protein ABIG39_05105 [Candidatus Micrarchaeota archaeon]
MDGIETIGIIVGLAVILIEAVVVFRMQAHIGKLGTLTSRLDKHITHMDKHIDLMDERVKTIRKDISLVCKRVGVGKK